MEQSTSSKQAQPAFSPGTLGAVLYAKPAEPVPSEEVWVRLVHLVADGEPLALHELYVRSHRPVFTLIMRLTSNREIAEELTLDVYQGVWQMAPSYDPTHGTVLAWIMNQARSRAVERLRIDMQRTQGEPSRDAALLQIDAPDYRHLHAAKERTRSLQVALSALTAAERGAIEAVFFSEIPYIEAAARLGLAPAGFRAQIRSALHRLGADLGHEDAAVVPIEASLCERAESICVHAVQAAPAEEVGTIEAHLVDCWRCRRELETLRTIIDWFVFWPADVLRPPVPLEMRLAARISSETGREIVLPVSRTRRAPAWENVAPGIECRLLATDADRQVVSMLVRLAPGGEYPPHTHAGVEELHLLDGELWIDDRKLQAGEYNRAEPGTCDKRVWSETGCTCVLVTSARDVLA